MSDRPWYKRYGGDFVMGTMGLTLEERGAYSLFIDLMHDRGGPMSDDAKYFANVMGVSVKRWKTIRGRLIEAGKIIERDGFLTQKRVEKDLKNVSKIKKLRSEAGTEGGLKSGVVRNKNNDITEANASNSTKQNGSKSAVRAHKPEARGHIEPPYPHEKTDAGPDADPVQQTHDRVVDIAGADPVRSPAWMASTVVGGWLAEGIDPGTIVAAVEGVMAKRTDAPRGPSYFTPAVREAHESRPVEIDPAEAEQAQRMARLRALVNTGHWGDWGDKPTPEAARAELAGLLEVTD